MNPVHLTFPEIRWRFWLVMLAIAIPFLAMLFSAPLSWDMGEAISVFSIVAFALVLVFIAWRGVVLKRMLARTGLEWAFTAGLIALVLSLYFSPDVRMGYEQAAWSVGYIVVFFLLIELFQSGISRSGIYYGLLLVSGLVAASACMDVVNWYVKWWQGIGSIFIQPPYPYRLVSVLGHPNIYMVFVNLLAPLAVSIFFLTRRLRARIFSAVWLVLYLISVPFSGSRGGWFGMIAWAGVLAIFWLIDGGWGARLAGLLKRHKVAGSILFLAGFLVAAGISYKVWTAFSLNPTHAPDLFGGRLELWSDALRVWQISPWFGVGVGRYLYGFLQVTSQFPPGFWSFHAHNVFLTVLAEEGVVGLGALLLFIGLGLYQLNRWRLQSPPDLRLWVSAMFAGIVGFLVHSLFDDFTTTLPVMVTVLLLAALIRGSVAKRAIPEGRVSFSFVFIPVLAGLALAAWLAWSGQPFAQALEAANNWQWRKAAELADLSVQRDPDFVFNQVEAGLAWSQVWGIENSDDALSKARAHFDRALKLEPSLSLVWANAAVLDWYAGYHERAIDRMGQAEKLSSAEPSFPLNLGWYYEEENRLTKSREEYLRTLQLMPAWSTHPFWQDDGFREILSNDILLRYEQENAALPQYWKKAYEAVLAGKLDEAQRYISLSESESENRVAILVAKIELADAQGNHQLSLVYDDELLKLVAGNYLGDGPSLASMYASFHKREGFDIEVVPKYIKLSENFGQFDVLARHFNQQITEENCQEAQKMLQAIKNASSGGEIIYEPLLSCGYPTR